MCVNKVTLGVGCIALVLAMSACQKKESPKATPDGKPVVSGIGDFQQRITMKTPLTEMKAGEVVKPVVTISNTSSANWPTTGSAPVNFSYHWADRTQKVVVFDGERTPLPKDLKAGATVDVNATIKAPSQPGEYLLQMTMVQENVAWFDHKGAKPLIVSVRVK
jgi:hypothetical protein